MRHHRRPDDADGKEQGARAAEAREQPAQRFVHRGADAQRLIQKAEKDDPQHRRDRQLEAAEAAPLQLENRERDHSGDQARRQQRHAEQQVQTQGGAEKLGDVRRHRHHLGLHPHAPRDRAREPRAHHLGEVVIGDDAELRREVLDQHRDQVRGQDHPQQQIAELGAALDVRGEVAGIDIGDRGHEGGPEHRQRGAQPTSRELLLERARDARAGVRQADRGGLAGGFERRYRRGPDRRHAWPSSSMRIARARRPPIG